MALAALAATAALAVFCFVKVVGLVLPGPPRHAVLAVEAPVEMRAAVVALAGACVVLGLARGCFSPRSSGWRRGRPPRGTQVGLQLPGTGSLPTAGIAVALVGLTAGFVLLRSRRSAAPAPTWACGQRVEPRLQWTSAGFTKPLRLMLEVVLRPQREIVVRETGGVVQDVSYSGHVPHLIDEHLYRPVTHAALAGAARGACRAAGWGRTSRT